MRPNHFQPHAMKKSASSLRESLSISGSHFGLWSPPSPSAANPGIGQFGVEGTFTGPRGDTCTSNSSGQQGTPVSFGHAHSPEQLFLCWLASGRFAVSLPRKPVCTGPRHRLGRAGACPAPWQGGTRLAPAPQRVWRATGWGRAFCWRGLGKHYPFSPLNQNLLRKGQKKTSVFLLS